MATLAEEYLTFDNSEGLIDAKLYDMIIDCFNKSYKAICDFYNFGENILKSKKCTKYLLND